MWVELKWHVFVFLFFFWNSLYIKKYSFILLLLPPYVQILIFLIAAFQFELRGPGYVMLNSELPWNA